MIVATVGLFAAFVVTRVLLVRARLPSTAANVAACAIVAAFLAGSVARPFGRPDVAETDATLAAATDVTPVPPSATYPPPTEVASQCKAASRVANRTSGYFDTLADATHASGYQLDGAHLDRAGTYVASGWAIDVDGKQPALGACLSVDGVVVKTKSSTYGLRRPDVARSLSDFSLLPVGFRLSVPGTSIPLGAHTLGIAVLSHDGSYVGTRNTWRVTVR